MKQQTTIMLLKLITGFSLFTGIIAVIFVFFLSAELQKKTSLSPSLTPSISPTPGTTSESEGEFCGGIAGIQCPDGYTCKLDGNYPDAGGKCVATKKITTPTCRPRPSCLDNEPYCMIPETPDMCPKAIICTADAKQCPDGSWVGRTGSNCEFVCPN